MAYVTPRCGICHTSLKVAYVTPRCGICHTSLKVLDITLCLKVSHLINASLVTPRALNRRVSVMRPFLQSMASLWRRNILCDVSLKSSDGDTFKAHRCALAATSAYFYAMFCSCCMRECRTKSVHLKVGFVVLVAMPIIFYERLSIKKTIYDYIANILLTKIPFIVLLGVHYNFYVKNSIIHIYIYISI